MRIKEPIPPFVVCSFLSFSPHPHRHRASDFPSNNTAPGPSTLSFFTSIVLATTGPLSDPTFTHNFEPGASIVIHSEQVYCSDFATATAPNNSDKPTQSPIHSFKAPEQRSIKRQPATLVNHN
jgi:hypothetical protein